MSSDCVECVLCRGLLPTSNDEQDILLTHMKEHHRVFVNIPFIISACFLDQEGIKATLAFITSRTNSVEAMVEDSDPLEMAGRESSSSKIEDPDQTPATMEELPDISQSEDSEEGLDVGEKITILVNEVSVEDSRSEEDHLESHQGILLSQSFPRTENEKTNISALEYLSEDNPDKIDDDDGDYFHSKRPKKFLTLQDLKLYQTDHSYFKFKSDKSSYKTMKKKTKKKVLKSTPITKPDVNVALSCNEDLPLYIPEPREEKIDHTQSKMTKEEEEDTMDIKDEEIEDIENSLNPKESRRQRLLALCLEECGEKKARVATDNHLRVYHAGERSFPCDECPKKFKKSHKLEIHRRLKHTEKSHNCDICGKYFDDVYYITQHKKEVHHLNQESQTCDICGKVFKCRTRLKQHKERTHSEKHQCPICGLKMRAQNINEHLVGVHGRKDLQKHVCDICGKGFFRTDKLKNHRLIHGDVRPFPCRFEGCDFASKLSGNRNKHEVNKHGRVYTALNAQS